MTHKIDAAVLRSPPAVLQYVELCCGALLPFMYPLVAIDVQDGGVVDGVLSFRRCCLLLLYSLLS